MKQAETAIQDTEESIQSSHPLTAVGAMSDSSGPSGPSHLWSVSYPFPAIIGYTAAKRALLMLAVDRELRGVLIGSRDSDAVVIARSFAELLADVDLNSNCPVTIDSAICSAAVGIVELPISITEDRLLGGLDLERTLFHGTPQLSKGVLASANGRVLYVNHINLLEQGKSGHLAEALDRRCVKIERDGVSAVHDADFTLIGTFNADDGEPAALLRDRIGLIVELGSNAGDNQSVEIIQRALRFDLNSAEFNTEFDLETSTLKQAIETSRARLPLVRITTDQIRQLSEIAIRFGVEGNRADIFAVRAARASAALAGRDCVTEDDLTAAIQLVLIPRATLDPETATEREQSKSIDEEDSKNAQNSGERGTDGVITDSIDDLVLQAIDARIADNFRFNKHRATRASRSGKRLQGSQSLRGRYVRSQTRRISSSRVAIDATLRAAAPHQTTRPQKTRQSASRTRMRIEPCDLRYKQYKHRSGILFILAVDASGSMALNRIAQAKGAVTRLLQQAYLHRDQVALVSFRRNAAEVLLTPTRSIELAKRLTDAIPAGGATPLAAGIAKALEIARSAKLRGMPQAMLLLFTDGRANVLFSHRTAVDAPTIGDELRQLGLVLHNEEIKTVLIDTKPKHLDSGEGKAVADLLGARYLSLLRSDSKSIYEAITSAAERHRDV